MMGACARNMWSDSAEIKPAQCCINLVFNLTYTMMHGNKIKIVFYLYEYLNHTSTYSPSPYLKYSNSTFNFALPPCL